jgi:uncharacterized membrane protein YhiD involved in acid resistance|tara:strand:+ start:1310 stop:1555 length:246 start_codon:yes stop_codon:yes gene_type:complete
LAWKFQLQLASKTIASTVLGGLTGMDRLWHRREASMIAYAAAALCACGFAFVSQHIPGTDPSRVLVSTKDRMCNHGKNTSP